MSHPAPMPPDPNDLRSLAILHQYYQAMRPSPARRLLQMGRDFVFFVPLLVALLFGLEFVNAPDYKPSTLLGNWIGSEEAAKLRMSLQATQQALAAQNQENEKLQEAVERFKMDLSKVQGAYQASYQRINDMTKVMADMEAKNFELKQKFVTTMESGKAGSAAVMDMYASFFDLFGWKKPAQALSDKAAVLKEDARQELRVQTANNLVEAQANLGQWLAGLPSPEEVIRADRDNPLRPEPYAAPPARHPFYATPSRPGPASESAARAPAAAQRLARINDRWPEVFIRSEPKGGQDTENKICVLSPGAVVNLLEDRSFDPDKKIMFAHVRFPRQGHGEARGWISEKALEEFSGSGQDGRTPQRCEPPKPEQG